jgi:hypothetical protein
MKKSSFRRWRRPPCSKCGGRFRDHVSITDHKYESDPRNQDKTRALSDAHEFIVKVRGARAPGDKPIARSKL